MGHVRTRLEPQDFSEAWQMVLRATIDCARLHRQEPLSAELDLRRTVRPVSSSGIMLALAVTLTLVAGAVPGLAEAPPAPTDRGPAPPQAPQRGDGAGGEGPAGPQLREDEPGMGGRDNQTPPEADEEASPPSGSGCPYRGRRLELIV